MNPVWVWMFWGAVFTLPPVLWVIAYNLDKNRKRRATERWFREHREHQEQWERRARELGLGEGGSDASR